MNESAARHEVFARVAWAMIDVATDAGIASEQLFEGLPFDAKSVRRLKRVAWSDYIMLCENVERLAGSRLQDMLENGYHQVFPEVRASIGALLDPKLLLKFLTTIANPMAFKPATHRFEDLGDRHVRVTVRLREGARPSETWFRGSIGALRGVPRYLDLPPAEVSAQIGPDFGIYDITLPPNRTIFRRLRRKFDEQLHSALIEWKRTRHHLEVLRNVPNGESNQQLAHVLETTELVIELIVAALLNKTRRTD